MVVHPQHRRAGIFTSPSLSPSLFHRIPHFLASLAQYSLAQVSICSRSRVVVQLQQPQDRDFHQPLTASIPFPQNSLVFGLSGSVSPRPSVPSGRSREGWRCSPSTTGPGFSPFPRPLPCFPLSLGTPVARIPPRQDQDGMLAHPSPSPPLWQQHLAPHIPAVPLPTWQPLARGGPCPFSCQRTQSIPKQWPSHSPAPRLTAFYRRNKSQGLHKSRG